MLFFMVSSSVHFPAMSFIQPIGDVSGAGLVSVFGLIAALSINGVMGKTGPMTSVKGVIHMGLALTVVLYLLIDLL